MDVRAFKGVGKLLSPQKFRPKPMKGYGGFIYLNYSWFEGYDRFIDFELH